MKVFLIVLVIVCSNILPAQNILCDIYGKPIKNKEEWETKAKPEIINYYEQNIYGLRPKMKINSSFVVLLQDTTFYYGTKAIHKEVQITMESAGKKIQSLVTIFIPVNLKAPPVFLGLNFNGNQTISDDTTILVPKELNRGNGRGSRAQRWPIDAILKRGYAVATACYTDFANDNKDALKSGVYSLVGDKDTSSNQWGTISVWAWGLSKIADYLKTDNDLKNSKIIGFGHSRLGKAAIWCGATDTRFDMIISNNSGCAGAALFKRDVGENIRLITQKFPYWFCKNFPSFADKESQLKIDQHLLLGLIAPRAVYVASAKKDTWADPEGEYLSLYKAEDVFKLYGHGNCLPDKLPSENSPAFCPSIGYHIRSGEHELKLYDWQQFIRFADEVLK